MQSVRTENIPEVLERADVFRIFIEEVVDIQVPHIFGLFGIFLTRIFVEMVKVDQSDFEAGMLLNMGQLLSVPFVLLAIWMLWQAKKGRFPVGLPNKDNADKDAACHVQEIEKPKVKNKNKPHKKW